MITHSKPRIPQESPCHPSRSPCNAVQRHATPCSSPFREVKAPENGILEKIVAEAAFFHRWLFRENPMVSATDGNETWGILGNFGEILSGWWFGTMEYIQNIMEYMEYMVFPMEFYDFPIGKDHRWER